MAPPSFPSRDYCTLLHSSVGNMYRLLQCSIRRKASFQLWPPLAPWLKVQRKHPAYSRHPTSSLLDSLSPLPLRVTSVCVCVRVCVWERERERVCKCVEIKCNYHMSDFPSVDWISSVFGVEQQGLILRREKCGRKLYNFVLIQWVFSKAVWGNRFVNSRHFKCFKCDVCYWNYLLWSICLYIPMVISTMDAEMKATWVRHGQLH